jgi:hypothetical protein
MEGGSKNLLEFSKKSPLYTFHAAQVPIKKTTTKKVSRASGGSAGPGALLEHY